METTLLRRSNGRPQACDPCRFRKVACDHGHPTCSRCTKRRQTCIYTTAPTPKPKRNPLPRSRAPISTPSSTPTPPCTGYLGFTSHSAVFEETRNSLTLVHGSRPVDSSPRRGPRVRSEMPPPLRSMYMFVLRNLPKPEELGSMMLDPCQPDGWIMEATKRIIQKIQDTFPAQHDDDALEDCARTICANTARPFCETDISTQDWIDQFTGVLRWESIGLLWTFWDFGKRHRPFSEQASDSWGGAGGEMVGECLKYCIELALHFTPGNEIILHLCFRRSTMESINTGDASNYHGETVALMTFLGLHAEPPTPEYRPTLCSENKRRLFARVFNIDKVMVSFSGRPPLISRRYSSTPLPLDLSDDDLFADDETINRAVQALDERGWNTEGKLLPATRLRARVMIAFIRDELLEIALSLGSHTTLAHLHTMAEFPVGLIYRPEEVDDPEIDTDTVFSRMFIKLEHLQNLFFIERLMLRFRNANQSDLLVTSFEMVSLTLLIWKRQDRFASIRRDFEWLLMAYAAPGGGILCLELLRPTFHGIHPESPKLSRSSIIQQLSLLIGFLDWVRPSAPNADLCADCKAIIQGVLDHNLNVAGGEGALETLDWEGLQLDFNFDLLDTFDWLRE
ncbi:hypothetical protein G7Z17_g5125 [Cylindrodendrum hubeiense]|uniref:Zn(2)-C6 fungal-type domain-containing protein n=1 Tax=Cylindrodendrum hubeiense TaxID=595255 RepID=A0A9P5LI60_9HYPO|nr:hypothetical protein G7Z17_g5125 [Cylindrodendrum hubeiense]